MIAIDRLLARVRAEVERISMQCYSTTLQMITLDLVLGLDSLINHKARVVPNCPSKYEDASVQGHLSQGKQAEGEKPHVMICHTVQLSRSDSVTMEPQYTAVHR